jgi:hypothetical protein
MKKAGAEVQRKQKAETRMQNAESRNQLYEQIVHSRQQATSS